MIMIHLEEPDVQRRGPLPDASTRGNGVVLFGHLSTSSLFLLVSYLSPCIVIYPYLARGTMSGSTSQQTPTMGGLEALVAAANAANQTQPNAQNKRKRDVDDAMIDPALQVCSPTRLTACELTDRTRTVMLS